MAERVGADADDGDATERVVEPAELGRCRTVMRHEEDIRAQGREFPLGHRLDIAREEQCGRAGLDPQDDRAVVVGRIPATGSDHGDPEVADVGTVTGKNADDVGAACGCSHHQGAGGLADWAEA